MIHALILAAMLPLNFTAPAGDSVGGRTACAKYLLLQTDEFGTTSTRTMFADSFTTSGQPVPRKPGLRERLWYQCSEDGKPRMYRIAGVDSSGNIGGLSNVVVNVAGAVPDTFYVDLTGTEHMFTWTKRTPLDPVMWYASWSRAYGDSSFTILEHWRQSLGTFTPVLSGREFQWRDSPAACATTALFGPPYWSEGDRTQPCALGWRAGVR